MDNSYRIVQLLARPNLKIFSAQFCIPVFVNKWLCDSYLGREIQIQNRITFYNAQCYDFKFHGGWAVQMDFLFENCTFEENQSILPFQINLTIICQRKSCEEF